MKKISLPRGGGGRTFPVFFKKGFNTHGFISPLYIQTSMTGAETRSQARNGPWHLEVIACNIFDRSSASSEMVKPIARSSVNISFTFFFLIFSRLLISLIVVCGTFSIGRHSAAVLCIFFRCWARLFLDLLHDSHKIFGCIFA